MSEPTREATALVNEAFEKLKKRIRSVFNEYRVATGRVDHAYKEVILATQKVRMLTDGSGPVSLVEAAKAARCVLELADAHRWLADKLTEQGMSLSHATGRAQRLINRSEGGRERCTGTGDDGARGRRDGH